MEIQIKDQKLNKMDAINDNDKNFILRNFIIIIFIITIVQIILFVLNNRKEMEIDNKQIISNSIDKDLDEEYKDMQEYVNMILNDSLYNPNEVFIKSKNPKISIVISVYNGEGYLKKALLSIENQDFKDIEIIMVDDCSKDNSVNLIKELMVKDPRIKLYQNEQNRGILYTKTRGVLNAKGKYVMTLDEDNIYV